MNRTAGRITMRNAGAALVAALLGACATLPGTAHHPAPLEAATVGLSGTVAPALPPRWWQALGDPQLDALMERALRDNPSLADALARLERARAGSVAADSARRPRVDASADIQRERYPAGYLVPPPYAGNSEWDGQLQLGLDWNLDFWGRQRSLVRAAVGSERASALDARAAQLAIEGAVVTAYLELDGAEALAELAADTERNRAALAELTRRRVAAGLDTNVELRGAAARVPEARAEREQLQARIDLAIHALAALSGQGADAWAHFGRPRLDYGAALTLPPQLPADLLLRRPDVAAALERVRSAAASEDAARLASYPQVDLRAFAGFASLGLSDLISAPSRTYGAGPVIALPIFDAGLLRARLHGAGADLDSAIAQYDRTVLAAIREAGDGLTQLAALDRQMSDAQSDLDLLSDAQRLAQERYGAGITAKPVVLEAEARVLAARRSLVATRQLEATQRVALLLAVGGSTEPPAPPQSAEATP